MHLKFILLNLFLLINTIIFSKSINELLPDNNEIPLWNKNKPAKIHKANQLYEYINGGADIYLEYGFNQVITQEYISGAETIIVDIFEMTDPPVAFGIYSIHRDYKKPDLNIGDNCTLFDFHVAFWQNRYYVLITGFDTSKVVKSTLVQFAEKVSERIEKHSKPPEILSHIPENNLLSRSKGYLKGILGLNSKIYLGDNDIFITDSTRVEGAFGTYQKNNTEAQLIMIHYPNAREAEEKKLLILNIFSKKFNKINKQEFLYKDSKGQFYIAMNMKNFLYIIIKAGSKEIINEIIRRQL